MTTTQEGAQPGPDGGPAAREPDKPLGVFRAIGLAHRTTWRSPLFYVLAILVTQTLVVACAIPLFRLIYQLVLSETGLGSIAYDKFAQVARNPLADVTLFVLAILAVLVVLAGLSTILILADHHQADGATAFRAVLLQLRDTARKLLHPQGLLLVVYLLLLLPLGQFGLTASLTNRIAVPPFVSEELSKTPSGNALYGAFVAVVFFLNVRLVFVLPVLATTTASVWRSVATSWRLTRGTRWLRVIGLVAVISIPAGLVSLLFGVVTVVPTFVTDAYAPAWSPVAAAVGLAVWQIGSFVITALLTVMIAQSLVAMMRDWLPRLKAAQWRDQQIDEPTRSSISRRRRRILWGVAAAVTAVALVGASIVNTGPMKRLDASQLTQVIAHRGWVKGGVENTLPALDAAAKSGADRVEFDVQQTKDLKFVVMHDSNLQRLAGVDVEVKDLTQAELMAITVRANGLEAKIPSLEQWVDESVKLGIPQLLEVKLHGGESADLLPRLMALLDAKGVSEWYTYHSLSREVVIELKRLRPELTVGFIVAITFGGIPKVPCDFLVIEEQSYSERYLNEIHQAGYQTIVWTVDDQAKMRIYMEDGADAIISDQPDLGLAEQAAIKSDTGLASRLLDRVLRGLGA